MSPLGCLFLNCLLGGFYNCIHISVEIRSGDAVWKQIPRTIPFAVQFCKVFCSVCRVVLQSISWILFGENWTGGFDLGMCQMFFNSCCRNKRPNRWLDLQKAWNHTLGYFSSGIRAKSRSKLSCLSTSPVVQINCSNLLICSCGPSCLEKIDVACDILKAF